GRPLSPRGLKQRDLMRWAAARRHTVLGPGRVRRNLHAAAREEEARSAPLSPAAQADEGPRSRAPSSAPTCQAQALRLKPLDRHELEQVPGPIKGRSTPHDRRAIEEP